MTCPLCHKFLNFNKGKQYFKEIYYEVLSKLKLKLGLGIEEFNYVPLLIKILGNDCDVWEIL